MTAAARWTIRRLGQGDLPLFRPLWLQALRDHPAAFGVSFEEEADRDLSYRIGDPPDVTLGAFVDDALVGTAASVVAPRIKQRHKGHVVGVYAMPLFRRTGLARALIDGLITSARESGLLSLTLSVTAGNDVAKSLYLRSGFTVYGVEAASLRVGSDLFDEDLMLLRL